MTRYRAGLRPLGVPLGPAESLQCASHERDVAVVIKHGCPHIPHPRGPHGRCWFRTSVLNTAEEVRPARVHRDSGRAHSVGRASRPSAALPVAGRDPSEPRPGRSRPAARPINWSAAIEAGPRAGRPGAMPAVIEGVWIGPNEESPVDPPTRPGPPSTVARAPARATARRSIDARRARFFMVSFPPSTPPYRGFLRTSRHYSAQATPPS